MFEQEIAGAASLSFFSALGLSVVLPLCCCSSLLQLRFRSVKSFAFTCTIASLPLRVPGFTESFSLHSLTAALTRMEQIIVFTSPQEDVSRHLWPSVLLYARRSSLLTAFQSSAPASGCGTQVPRSAKVSYFLQPRRHDLPCFMQAIPRHLQACCAVQASCSPLFSSSFLPLLSDSLLL